MGAPLKNGNRTRHGLRASKLPRGCQYVERAILLFRLAVEEAVLRMHGEIGVLQAALIQSSLRSEQRAMLCERWLREADAKGLLSLPEQIKLLRERDMASARRDNCLRELLTPIPTSGDDPGRRTIDVMREMKPDELAEFKAKAKAAADANLQAIEHLRQAERIEQARMAEMGQLIPPSTFPDVSGEAVPIDVIAGANGSCPNDTANAPARLTVDASASVESQLADLVEADADDWVDA